MCCLLLFRFMEKMISCIKDNIEANCDKEAATLVSLLVKPVVETGSYCRYNLTAETQVSENEHKCVENILQKRCLRIHCYDK